MVKVSGDFSHLVVCFVSLLYLWLNIRMIYKDDILFFWNGKQPLGR